MNHRLQRTVQTFMMVLGMFVVIPFLPAAADTAPPEDRDWGAADYQTANARYQARVQNYELERDKLTLHRQQLLGELQLVWTNWPETTRRHYEEQFDRSFDGIQHRARVQDLETDERNARNLHQDFVTNCTRCDPEKPDVREREFSFHLDYLRQRNKRAAADNLFLQVKIAHINASTAKAFEEWVRDNRDDLTFVTEAMLQELPREFYNSCIKGVMWKRIADNISAGAGGPAVSPGSSLARNCLQSTVFGTFVNGIVAALKKQFYDDLASRDIHREVAEYWLSAILLPKAEGAEAWADDVEKIVGDLFARELRRQAGALMKELALKAAKEAFAQNPIGTLQWNNSELRQRIYASYTADIRRTTETFRSVTFVSKAYERILPMIYAKWDFNELQRTEIPKYWKIRNCIESRTDRPRQRRDVIGREIVGVLKLPLQGYVDFLTACRGREQVSCSANIEMAKGVLSETARAQSALLDKAGLKRVQSAADKVAMLAADLRQTSQDVSETVTKNASLCATAKVEQQNISNLLKRAQDDAQKTTQFRDTARSAAAQACGTQDMQMAEAAARNAKDASQKAARIGDGLAAVLADVQRRLAETGGTVDVSAVDARRAVLAADVEELQSAIATATQDRNRLVAGLTGSEASIEACTGQADREVRARLTSERQAVIGVQFGSPQEVSGLLTELQSMETQLAALTAQQETSLTCFRGLPDPAASIADVKSWKDAAELFVEATAEHAARAAQCVQALQEAAERTRQRATSANEALAACRFGESRRLIDDLPQGPERQSLSDRWNKAYEVEGKVRDLAKEAMALKDQGQFESAINTLRRALNLSLCDSTVASIERAIANIRDDITKADAARAEAALAACKFRDSRELIGKLPQGATRQSLVNRWNSSYEKERRARDLIQEAVTLRREGQFRLAVGKLHQAGNLDPCDSTAAAIDKTVADIQQQIAEAEMRERNANANATCQRDYGNGYHVSQFLPDGRFYCAPDQATADAWCRGHNTGPGWFAQGIRLDGGFDCRQSEEGQRAAAEEFCRRQHGDRLIRVYKKDGQWWCEHQTVEPPPPRRCPPGYNPYGCL
ncbi:MAG: hypothetical protein KDK89_00950 [Alphaproteobacteria bacterium]|nr:hypothetical protein [Alphaproteobacteria bacterium]